MWPPCSPDHTLLYFFLWSCAKDQAYNQSVNTLDELESASRGDYGWDVCTATDGVHCGVFHT